MECADSKVDWIKPRFSYEKVGEKEKGMTNKRFETPRLILLLWAATKLGGEKNKMRDNNSLLVGFPFLSGGCDCWNGE